MMSKWFKVGLVGLLVFGAVAVLMTGIAFAQDDTTPAAEMAHPGPGGRGFGRLLGGQAGLEAAADALGMTAEELSAQLWAGKTLAEIAEDKGVDLVELHETVQAAVQSEMEVLQAEKAEAMREAFGQALENGTITQDHYDWLIEGLDNDYIPGPGFGDRGRFRGGFQGRGLRDFGQPGFAPQLDPSGGE
jgi:hypothetical protein